MFRVRVPEKITPGTTNGDASGAVATVLASEFVQTHHASLPLVVLARLFGMMPGCIRRPQRMIQGSKKIRRNQLRHVIGHALLWIYCFFVWLTSASLTGFITVYAVATSQVQRDINWLLFDVITSWQTTLIMLHLIFWSPRLKWFISSLDHLFIAFAPEHFERPEMVGERMIVDAQLTEAERHEEAEEEGILTTPAVDELGDEEEFVDNYVTHMRAWVIAITLIGASLTLFSVSCLVAFRFPIRGFTVSSDYANTTHVPKARVSSPLSEMVVWASHLSTRENLPGRKTSDGVGLLGECMQVATGLLSPALFASGAICLTMLLSAFNHRLRLVRDNALDLDRAILFHFRFKRLLRRLERTYDGVVFFAVIGDLGVIISGTFMGLSKNCTWSLHQHMDNVCLSYILRHIVVLVQLLTITIFGATLHEKMRNICTVVDVYLSRNILNTERLKVMGVLQEVHTCSFNVWGFFRLSRPFILTTTSLVAIYISAILRQSL